MIKTKWTLCWCGQTVQFHQGQVVTVRNPKTRKFVKLRLVNYSSRRPAYPFEAEYEGKRFKVSLFDLTGRRLNAQMKMTTDWR